MEGLNKTLKSEREEKERAISEKIREVNALHEALATSEGSLMRKTHELEGEKKMRMKN
jgi:hypothetical protein